MVGRSGGLWRFSAVLVVMVRGGYYRRQSGLGEGFAAVVDAAVDIGGVHIDAFVREKAE